MIKRLKFNTEQIRRASSVLQKIDLRMSSKDFSNYQDIIDIMIFILLKPCELRSLADVELLKQATRSLDFFANLGSDLLHEQCCRNLRHKYVPIGYFIFKEGEQGDNFYFIISGRVQVLKDFNPSDPQASIFDNEIKQLSNFETFGERAMDSDALRTASVRAIENTHLAYLNKDSYQIIAKSVKNQLKKAYFEEFANLDFFHNWRFQDIKVFYDRAYVKKYSMNATVYKEGDPLDYVYIIKKGEFKIVKIIKTSTIDLNEMFKGDFEKILCGMSTPRTYTISERLEARFQRKKYGNLYYMEKKKPVTIKYITTGQMFGEMEFLMQNNNTRTHSVYSVTEQSELYMVKREYFETILDKVPSIKNALIQLSEQKNNNFMRQLLQYEKHFNDLTEVKKDLERNINLDFLQLGSTEKRLPSPVLQQIRSTQPVVKKVVKIPKIEREVQRIETKKKFLMRKRKKSAFKIHYSNSEMDGSQYNFISSIK
ncbi:unnamed protein product [Paramecium primaurelia]|uniref:Cyclic nucleotide-binding domain-containing protein n=1 Tax=Paramecium primaurelia TaxID=5886 RepID=A0A8S1L8N5_PARPR|nr:unnamed protein product [Paramecium primaurelia]